MVLEGFVLFSFKLYRNLILACLIAIGTGLYREVCLWKTVRRFGLFLQFYFPS